MTWGLWGTPPSSPTLTLTLTLTGSSALHCHLLPPLTSFLDQRFFSPLGFDVFVWESCELKAIKQKTVVHMWQCFYSYITGKSSQFWYPRLWGDPWSDHKHPGQLCKKNESDARRTIHDLREQMELLFFPFFFFFFPRHARHPAQLRSPPCIEHVAAAASVACWKWALVISARRRQLLSS